MSGPTEDRGSIEDIVQQGRGLAATSTGGGTAGAEWKGLDDLEIATAEWVDWLNHRRPFEYCDDLTPLEAEQAHYAHHQTPTTVGVSN